MAQAENEEMLKREPYIDMVIGPQSYHKLNTLIKILKLEKKLKKLNLMLLINLIFLIKLKIMTQTFQLL